MLDWSRVTLIERSSSLNYIYKWLRHLSLVLRRSRSMTNKEYKAIWLKKWTLHTLGTQIRRSWSNLRWRWSLSSRYYWKSFGWLKQVERKGLKEGIKITHQDKSITWINQQIHFKWVSRMVLGERSLLPSVGAYRLCVGNQVWYLEG